MSGRCRRLWEVEAARDGRLVGDALRDFELHTEACKDCRAERRAMTRLGRALAESSDASDDEVSLRRERDRLLAAADAAHRERPTSRRIPRIAVAAAVAVFVLGAGAALYPKRLPRAEEPVVSVTPVAGAQWARSLHGNVEEISLTDGTLSVVVHRTATDHRVAVRVPDGLIEDIGTAFRVTVREGRTREIVVDDGAVVFHGMGSSAFVGRGAVWVPAPAPGAAALPAPPTTAAAPLAAAIARPTAKPKATALRSLARSEPVPTPEESAVAAEDAAYLRIIALRRDHRTDAARAAAAEYLTAFPNGFRRAEVLRFALLPH